MDGWMGYCPHIGTGLKFRMYLSQIWKCICSNGIVDIWVCPHFLVEMRGIWTHGGGEGSWQGYCPRNGVSLSLKPTKANIVHQNMLKHSFPFLKQPKTRQIAYSANLGNTFSLSCFQKAATLGLSQPPVSSAFFVANFKAFEEGFRFCIESLQSNLLLEHLYVGPLYRCSINNMVQIFSFSPKIPLHRRTLHCARRKSKSSMHRDLRRWPEYGHPAQREAGTLDCN